MNPWAQEHSSWAQATWEGDQACLGSQAGLQELPTTAARLLGGESQSQALLQHCDLIVLLSNSVTFGNERGTSHTCFPQL